MSYLIGEESSGYGTFIRVYVDPAPGGRVAYEIEKKVESDYRNIPWHVVGVYDTFDEVAQRLYFLEDDEISEMKEKADRIIAKYRGKVNKK